LAGVDAFVLSESGYLGLKETILSFPSQGEIPDVLDLFQLGSRLFVLPPFKPQASV